MSKLRRTGIIFLLIVLTFFIVFVPQLVGNYDVRNQLNKTTYRFYNVGSRPKLTSKQVAKLYYNRQIDISYNLLHENGVNGDAETIREDVKELVELLLGDDKTVCTTIQDNLREGQISYSRSSSLIKIENRPTALNFVRFGLKSESGFFEIFYEEKTRTIINFSCDILEMEFNNTKELELYLAKIVVMLNNYFQEDLSFTQEETFFVVNDPWIIEGEETKYLSKIYISCGLTQQDRVVAEKQDIVND